MVFSMGAIVLLVAALSPEVLWGYVRQGIPSQPDAVNKFLSYFPGALQQTGRISAAQVVFAVVSMVLAVMGRRGSSPVLRIASTVTIIMAVLLLLLKAFQAM